MVKRMPVVAGAFYPADARSLEDFVSYVANGRKSESAIAGISPHAGYGYSGDIAGMVWSSLPDADTYLILGPNHTGLGPLCSLADYDVWVTPLGNIEADKRLSDALSGVGGIEFDQLAHVREHSIEVQLPFLQYNHKGSKVVCLCVASGVDLLFYKEIGRGIANILGSYSKKVVLVISSDMNHYEAQETTVYKDELAISALEEVDPDELFSVVSENRISMCGVYPALILLSALNGLSDNILFEMLSYKTSSDINGDIERVVGYLGGLFVNA